MCLLVGMTLGTLVFLAREYEEARSMEALEQAMLADRLEGERGPSALFTGKRQQTSISLSVTWRERTGIVMIHERKIVEKRRQLTPFKPFIIPMAMVAPVMHCVVEMGRPMREAKSTVMAAPISMQ
mgnify:CR=1 FL=1